MGLGGGDKKFIYIYKSQALIKKDERMREKKTD